MRLSAPGKAALLGSIALLAVLPAAAQEPVPDPSSPWLGVYLVDEVDGGIRIVAVVPGGPASVAGLRSGDLLIEAGSVQLVDQEALERVLAEQGSDQELLVAVLRNGESRTFRVRPSDRVRPNVVPIPAIVPQAPRAPRPWAPLGLSPGLKTVPITEELRVHYGAPRDRGVLVVRVEEDGACGRAGIEVGDVLVGVGTEPVTSPAEVDLALTRRDRSVPLKLEFVRDRKPLARELAVETPPAATASLRMLSNSEARENQLERSIALLERQLETLRKQLAELKRNREAPKPEEPANPGR